MKKEKHTIAIAVDISWACFVPSCPPGIVIVIVLLCCVGCVMVGSRIVIKKHINSKKTKHTVEKPYYSPKDM